MVRDTKGTDEKKHRWHWNRQGCREKKGIFLRPWLFRSFGCAKNKIFFSLSTWARVVIFGSLLERLRFTKENVKVQGREHHTKILTMGKSSSSSSSAPAQSSASPSVSSTPQTSSGSSSTTKSSSSSSPANALFGWVWLGIALYVSTVIVSNAYEIRMGAINEFGAVIHEFDPYFNFRATEVRAVSLL